MTLIQVSICLRIRTYVQSSLYYPRHDHRPTLIQANLTREVLALNKRKISTEHQRSPCQLEIQFMHLKAAYENKPIEQHEGMVCSYQDPDDLARPLQHVRCDEFERFPAELREELCALGTALEIRDGRRLYLEVVSTIEKYLLRT